MDSTEKTVSTVLLFTLLGFLTIALAWDIWVLAERPPGTWTVSDQLEILFIRYPILAFIFGVLIGHVFHRSNGHQ